MGLSQLPPHSAVVAFNTPQVYQLAERLRQKRGGAAVVLGALSPRARNAQVALFQSGEVQYLVATDAIGMGLNLSVEHIALAALHKFDGKEGRALSLGELAQIAGRAGRYLVDGTFGTLAPCPALPLGVARAIESHQLPFERSSVFRNSDLDYASIPSLLASLTAQPRRPMLKRLGLAEADDTLALTRLGTRSEVVTWAQGRERVELLWQVCQIPDYGKLLPEAHAELVFQVYEQLITRGCLSEDWFAERLGRLDTTEGDLETLLSRIAFVRTWTYLSHQSSWVINAEHWQNQSRDLEDRLSDALHERLVQRFVERTARRVDLGQRSGRRRPSLRDEECAEFDPQSPFAALARLRLQPALAPKSVDLDAWIDASDEAFELTSTGRIESQGRLLGKLRRGSTLLHPEVRIELASQPGEQLRLERRLRALVRDRVASLLEPLREQDSDSAPMRGVLYQLRQALGCLPRKQVQEQLRQLRGAERADLRARGIEWDARFVLSRPLFTAPALRTRAALSSVHYQLPEAVLPRDAAEQYPRPSNVPSQALLALGYVALGDTCVRCDRLDPSTHGDGGPVPATQKAKRSNRRRRRTRKSRLELQ
jgi:ATP-dependent RNA helicase SUPV3L1/SUV3